jgi:hypothetical protein
VQTLRTRTPDGTPNTVNALTNLAFVLQQKGALDEAARDLDEALAIARRVLGARHPTVGHVQQSLAGLARAAAIAPQPRSTSARRTRSSARPSATTARGP